MRLSHFFTPPVGGQTTGRYQVRRTEVSSHSMLVTGKRKPGDRAAKGPLIGHTLYKVGGQITDRQPHNFSDIEALYQGGAINAITGSDAALLVAAGYDPIDVKELP